MKYAARLFELCLTGPRYRTLLACDTFLKKRRNDNRVGSGHSYQN
jgi:hypothetical protein